MIKVILNIYERIKNNNRFEKDFHEFNKCRRILDVGCGRGHFLKLLGERGIGIDGCPDNIKHCRSMGLNVFELMLPNTFPFDDKYFDGIYCSHILEHFLPNDVINIMQEIDRILKVGGVLFIRSPLFSPAFFDDPTHIRPYHLHSILHLLGGWEKSGTRQMIIGNECPSYALRTYYEEKIPLYIPKIAPTISPIKFPLRMLLRGISHLFVKFGVGKKGAYGAVLVKHQVGKSSDD